MICIVPCEVAVFEAFVVAVVAKGIKIVTHLSNWLPHGIHWWMNGVRPKRKDGLWAFFNASDWLPQNYFENLGCNKIFSTI